MLLRVEDHRPAFEGQLIRLRKPEPADAVELSDLFNDPEVGEHLGPVMPQPVAGFQAFVENADKDPKTAIFTIERLADRVPVGGCSLFEIESSHRSALLGVWLAKPYWNQGMGTDTVRTLCRFAFRHMNLQRVELNVFATNPRGLRAYEKVGFRVEGTLRRGEFVNGELVDSYVMGLLAEELVEDD
jgi:RimJ/RimL family protein N-acetyltransferase